MKNQIKKAVKFSTLALVATLVMATQKVNAQYWNLTGNVGTNPSINFLGTTDSVALKIRTDNVVRMTVTPVGKVGIGTGSPTNKLSVSGKADFSGNVGIGTTAPVGKLDVEDNTLSNIANFAGGNNMFIRLVENGVYRGYIGSYSGSAEDVDFGTGVSNTAGAINFTIKASPKMTINNIGFIGIGTTAPANKLSVIGNADFTGNVGIGTSTPATKLDVAGPGNWDLSTTQGDFRIGNGTYNIRMGVALGGAGVGYSTIAATTALQLGTGSTYPNLNTLNIVGGRVGIGTTSPQGKLNIVYNSSISDPQLNLYESNNDFARINFGNTATTNFWSIAGLNAATNANARLNFYNSVSGNAMSITGNGSVCIGTTAPATGYKLSVNGKVICEELKVLLYANWPDYVFKKDYKLPSLNELENYINDNNHLPGVPSAAAIEKEGGVEVGEMQNILLRKLEEANLYILQLNKRIENLEAKSGK